MTAVIFSQQHEAAMTAHLHCGRQYPVCTCTTAAPSLLQQAAVEAKPDGHPCGIHQQPFAASRAVHPFTAHLYVHSSAGGPAGCH